MKPPARSPYDQRMQPLIVPPAAQRDPDAVEMIRAWIAERGLHCVMNVGMWKAQGLDEPRAWGILLADVVRHVSAALRDETGADRDETAEAIVESLQAELDQPTSPMKGGFGVGHS